MKDEHQCVIQTRAWLEQVIIAERFCPFAKEPLMQDKVCFEASDSTELEQCLEDVISACQRLDKDSNIETTLVIFANNFDDFYSFLHFIELANTLLVQQHYEGVYQLAHFHPQYCFAGEAESDPANYTNRAPFPVIHILRERSLEQQLEQYKNPEKIPQRNISHARRLGGEYFIKLLKNIRNM